MPNRDYGMHSRHDEPLAHKQTAVRTSASKAADRDGKRGDKVDEFVAESFPASDPPASWAGPDLTPAERKQRAAKQRADKKA